MQQKPSRRRLRRIVTVLLFLIAAVGMVLGYAMNRRYQQQKAVEALQSLGGNVAATPSSLLESLE